MQVGSNIYNESWLSFALPEEKSSSNFLAEYNDYDGCKMFKTIDTLNPSIVTDFCTKDRFNQTNTEGCNEYIYDDKYFDETVVTKFNLVCDTQYKRNLLRTLLILGLLFGSLVGGRFGDQFGRKKALLIGIALICPTCIIGGYVDSYPSMTCYFN